MPVFATAGSKLFIGPAMVDKDADYVLADFTGPFVEIKNVEALGTLGDQSAEVTFDAIDQARTKRLKGTRAAPPMEVVCGIDYDDAGQQEIVAAERSPSDFSFKVVFNDAPAGGTPSERYFIAKVGSASEAYDTANAVMKMNATLWVNSNTVRVDAV